MVDDFLGRKSESMGSLAFIQVVERFLSINVQALAKRFVKLDIPEPSRVISYVVVQ